MLVFQNIPENIFCVKSHPKDILKKMRRVRIFFGIAVGVVHPMKYCVSPWV